MKIYEVNNITIELERKKIKNMYLKILPPDGRVHISAPYKMKEEQINRFIVEKTDWILVHQSKVRLKKSVREPDYITGDKILVWGKETELIVNEMGKINDVTYDGCQLTLTIKKGSTMELRKKIIDEWYRKALSEKLPFLIQKWEKIIGVNSNDFRIRDMKTRWGTCNIRTKNICFNLQLAKKAPKCLEYVVVHELVHLLEKSHNYIFKSYMDQFLPNWRLIKKELNNVPEESAKSSH